MATSDDERETGDDSTAPMGTPGYNRGSPLNPSMILPSMSPPRNTSALLRASGIPGMNDTGFSPFVQNNDSIQQPYIFGITDST